MTQNFVGEIYTAYDDIRDKEENNIDCRKMNLVKNKT